MLLVINKKKSQCLNTFSFFPLSHLASFTVTLNPPNPKKMFEEKQAELKCIITGLDHATVSNTKIQWYIDGQPVANNNEAQSESSTLIRKFDEWKKVKKVQCVATRDDMAPITESLDVNRGMPSKFNGLFFESNKCTNMKYMFVIKIIIFISVFQFEVCIFQINCKFLLGEAMPDVQVHKLSDNTNEVTLVCLVASSVLQDYYIAWLEASGTESGTYIDGINLPPQKINNSLYLVSSFHTISMAKWLDEKNKFSCNVWPAFANGKMKPHEVSSVSGKSCEY